MKLSEAIMIKDKVDIVCVGDSITGYNNFGDVWPLITYPEILQEIIKKLGGAKTVANGGQAGERSDVAQSLVLQYLRDFPSADIFIVGFGTNDLAGVQEDDVETGSRRIIMNLDRAIQAILKDGRRVIVFNVPYLNESMFGKKVVASSHRLRDYHNGKLADYCEGLDIPLADVCSGLKNEHFADSLHPNEIGARIIAETVYGLLMAG